MSSCCICATVCRLLNPRIFAAIISRNAPFMDVKLNKVWWDQFHMDEQKDAEQSRFYHSSSPVHCRGCSMSPQSPISVEFLEDIWGITMPSNSAEHGSGYAANLILEVRSSVLISLFECPYHFVSASAGVWLHQSPAQGDVVGHSRADSGQV